MIRVIWRRVDLFITLLGGEELVCVLSLKIAFLS